MPPTGASSLVLQKCPPSPHLPPPTVYQPALVTHHGQTSSSRGAGLRPGLGALAPVGGRAERRRPGKCGLPQQDRATRGCGDPCRQDLPCWVVSCPAPPGTIPAASGPARHPWTILPHPAVPAPLSLSPSSSKLPQGNHDTSRAQHTIKGRRRELKPNSLEGLGQIIAVSTGFRRKEE